MTTLRVKCPCLCLSEHLFVQVSSGFFAAQKSPTNPLVSLSQTKLCADLLLKVPLGQIAAISERLREHTGSAAAAYTFNSIPSLIQQNLHFLMLSKLSLQEYKFLKSWSFIGTDKVVHVLERKREYCVSGVMQLSDCLL